jgi:hypothetical protein
MVSKYPNKETNETTQKWKVQKIASNEPNSQRYKNLVRCNEQNCSSKL